MYPTVRLIFVSVLFALSTTIFAYQRPEPKWSDIGLTSEMQDVNYWLKRAPNGDKQLLSATYIETRNKLLLRTEPSMVYWPTWPDSLSAEEIRKRIQILSKRPTQPLFKTTDVAISESDIDVWMENLNLDQIKPSNNQWFGMVVIRASLRRFPTKQRAFDQKGGVDIDRLQESAVFPGTPLAVLHESRDKKWLFVQSENYAAWISAEALAVAPRDTVMAFASKQPRRYITGSQVRTVFHPYAKDISELSLDMGASFPIITNWPLSEPVNGQGSLGSWIIEFPVRSNAGILQFKPVLIPRSADSAPAPLPVSHANIIQQSFKFIGERYGWGHDYNARDCSGFVSEIYNSMGILLPRNTSDQAKSSVFDRDVFGAELTQAMRIERAKQLHVGDMVFIPGHVMLVIGHDEQGPWVIHDSHKTGFIVNGDYHAFPTNAVAVTPLLNMALGQEKLVVDAITAVQHIIPRQNP
ncbi:MAG: SH3 domain-containing protein [Arenimonas sp.]|nr:SH3 domain-containing protein [Arenimonas sp.]